MEGCIGERADALRVADAHGLAGDGEVSEETMLVREVAADAEQAAAGHGGERFDFEAVLVELKSSM